MKTKKITHAIYLAIIILILSACGVNNSSNSKGIPGYATGETAYLANRETKTSHAWCGKADINGGYKKFGRYTDSGLLAGTLIEMDDYTFLILKSRADISHKYLFEEQDEYSMELLWHDPNPENIHNTNMSTESSMLGKSFQPIECGYCDTYYFFKDSELAEAKSWIENLNKKPNQESHYNAKDEGGVKTYKATIGKVVTYFGLDELKRDRFLSIYLDCRAVVQLHDKDLKGDKLIGKTLDCVTDSNNKVVVYKLESEI